MQKRYWEYQVRCPEEDQDVLIGLLDEAGADSYLQEDDTIKVYVETDLELGKFTELEAIIQESDPDYFKILLEDKDWNATWESGFQPVVIDNKLLIRAPFHHAQSQFPKEIILMPKMAFGTGHHATTCMILENILDTDCVGKKVLDLGCGTGILAILAKQSGAAAVHCLDIDPVAIENTLENFAMNNVTADIVVTGVIEDAPDKNYDIIFANITRNILVEIMPSIRKLCAPNALVFFSGILESDRDTMELIIETHDLEINHIQQRDDWLCIAVQAV